MIPNTNGTADMPPFATVFNVTHMLKGKAIAICDFLEPPVVMANCQDGSLINASGSIAFAKGNTPSSLDNHVGVIISGRAQKKVIWIDTRLHIATMTNV